MQPLAVHIRSATLTDAQSIVRVHFNAVHQIPGVFYPTEVLRSWSAAPNEGRLNQVRREIAAGHELFVVAEIDGAVHGFGSIVSANEELRAIYVEPAFGRRGVGSAILRHLEQVAVAHKVTRLSMDASLNAESFYLKHGYSVVSRGVHRLSSGVEMACVKMSKGLTAS